ncbi:MAG: hypothetical protein ACXVLQ_03640 [Bacteriovorax sp.]
MQKQKYSTAFTMLILAFILAGLSMYLNRKKTRDLIALNESKSKLTEQSASSSENKLQALIKKNLDKQEEFALNQAGASNALTLERSFTETEINEMSEEQFAALLKDTERKLPKLGDLRSLPAGALHRTPPIVIQAGRDLGVLKEVLKVHESYERVAAPFYQTCAKSQDGVTAVKALCLTNLIEIKKKNGEALNLKEFPKQIIELAKMVTEI